MWRRFIAPRRPVFALVLLLILVSAGLGALFVWLLGDALSPILARAGNALPLWLPAAVFGLALAKAASDFAQAALLARAGFAIVADLQRAMFACLMRADLGALAAVHSGGRLSVFFADAQTLRDNFVNAIVLILRHAAAALALMGVMIALDPFFSLVFLPVGILASGILQRFFGTSARAARAQLQGAADLSAALLDRMDGVRAVKLAGREAHEIMRIGTYVATREQALVRGADARAAAAPFTDAIAGLAIALVLLLAAWRIREGAFDAADFLAFVFAAIQVGQALRQLAAQLGAIAEGRAAASRLAALLATPAEPEDAPSAPALAVGEGRISFENVRFSYRGANGPALDGLTLTFAAGKRTALVGASGSGKTTLLNLIPRFYSPDAGEVRIDGQNIAEASLKSLRDRIALVTQDPILFDDTVAANIAFERPDATLGDIEAAARAAGAGFIADLSEGMQTRIGQSGATLSGGQRQRLMLARAFLKNAPILLLDEPSAALDAHSAAELAAAIERLTAGRTVVIVAHNLASVLDVDEVVVLEKGRVVEQGPPALLLRQNGPFAALVARQVPGLATG